jgi:predicted nucleic acid-binding protein
VQETLEASEVDVHVPALCDVEVTAALRRAIHESRLSETRATEALQIYLDLPLVRHGHQFLLARDSP